MATINDVLEGRKRFSVVQGDCLAMMREMAPLSVDLIFCSPPYENCRLYLEDGEDMGIAKDTEEWVAWMVTVVKESLRVCKGLCAFVVEGKTENYRYSCGPALLMADLHRSGVCLRKPPVYHRVGIFGGGGSKAQHADDGGGADWLRNDWEFIVCATANQGKLPWADGTACGHPPKYAPGGEASHRMRNGKRVNGKMTYQVTCTDGYKDGELLTKKGSYSPPDMTNPGNVIHCNVGGGRIGHPLAHESEAPFPEKLAEFFVRSFCPENGICMDIFNGSGTTTSVAVRWNRRAIGVDLRKSQVDLALRRMETETPLSLFAEQP